MERSRVLTVQWMALNALSKKVNVGSELCEVVVDEGYTDM